MFNLLPHENKMAIRREYRQRLAVVALSAIFIAIIIFLILLIPSYVVSKVIYSGVSKEKDVAEQSLASRESTDLKSRLSLTKENLEVLVPREDGLTIAQLIDKVISLKNSGIKLTKLDYLIQVDNSRKLALEGISLDRDSLLEFKNKLTESKVFSNIILPVSNFTDEQNIQFQITLSGNF